MISLMLKNSCSMSSNQNIWLIRARQRIRFWKNLKLVHNDLNSYFYIPVRTIQIKWDLSILSIRTLTFIQSDSLSPKKLGRNGFLRLQKKVWGSFEGEKILWTDQRTQDQIDPLQPSQKLFSLTWSVSAEEFSNTELTIFYILIED